MVEAVSWVVAWEPDRAGGVTNRYAVVPCLLFKPGTVLRSVSGRSMLDGHLPIRMGDSAIVSVTAVA